MMTGRNKLFAIGVLLLAAGSYALSQAPPGTRGPTSAPPAVEAILGIVGDGRADETVAIQNAVDAGIGHIRLPKGTYRITKPIVIDLDVVGFTSFDGGGVAEIVMAGPGPALKFVGTHLKSADPGGFEDNVWQRQRMPSVDRLAIAGEHEDAIGIQAMGTMQLTVSRTLIRGVLHGIHLIENNRNVIVADCHIYENRGIGIYYDNANLHQSNISNCHISYNDCGGVVSQSGNVRNIHITGCDLESNMSPDTEPTANVLIDCSGSPYGTAEVAITGCTIQHNNPSPDSANIRMIGRSDSRGDSKLIREGNVTISGNVLSDVQVNVHLQDCRGVAITGNTFWQGYAHNLLIEDCSNIVVGPNSFDRNPRYSYGNTSEADNAVLVRRCRDCTLTGLHITNVLRSPAGLQIEDCQRFNVTGCTILDCDKVGLLLKNVAKSRVSDCLIQHDSPANGWNAIVVDGGGGNMIEDNLMRTK